MSSKALSKEEVLAEWEAQKILSNFRSVHAQCPALYANWKLRDMQPSENVRLPLDRQQSILNYLHEHPLGSYAFFGPPGTGKTAYMAGLFRHLCADSVKSTNYANTGNTFWYTLPSWLREQIDFQFGRGAEPRMSARTIAMRSKYNMGHAYVFLDEIIVGKADFNLAPVLDLFEVLKNTDSVICLTTNATQEELAALFGAHILDRIHRRCRVIDLFKEKP
jgi:DNA replication protein DnaC